MINLVQHRAPCLSLLVSAAARDQADLCHQSAKQQIMAGASFRSRWIPGIQVTVEGVKVILSVVPQIAEDQCMAAAGLVDHEQHW